ncbi:hypothetical protein P261_02653 [Lachnospiraceae bacterium TWA4]|nr:hypothetical protein P261_02653 [Lachnospiraceae bacterium TWA4]
MKIKNKIVKNVIFCLGCCLILSGCHKTEKASIESEKSTISNLSSQDNTQIEKGYNLTIPEHEQIQAEQDSIAVMNCYRDIYLKNKSENLSKQVLSDIINRFAQKNYCIKTSYIYSDIKNYEVIRDFLLNAKRGIKTNAVLYEINYDGGLTRRKFIYDGNDMYVIASKNIWNSKEQGDSSYISYTRIKEWRYSDNGWFCFELCVPEYPEATALVDGSNLIRIIPMTKENTYYTEHYLYDLGYQGNNLLCSNWDKDHLEELDYSGLYEYLYKLEYKKSLTEDKYIDGIPKDEFENLIMKYIPISEEQLRKYAEFDSESQTYLWARLGCGDYTPTYFGTSFPEVTAVSKKEDGSITLTIHAVCELFLCNEAIITHELMIQTKNDGTFQFISNKILGDGMKNIPEYQYRVNGSQ